VQVAQLTLSRRLLSTSPRDMIVYVWVYAGGGDGNALNDPVFPPSGAFDVQGMYVSDYRNNITSGLTAFLENVELDETCQISPFTTLPFRPALSEFSVTLFVDFKVNRTTNPDDDRVILFAAVVDAVSKTLNMNMTMTNIRFLSFHDKPDASRPALAVEIRVPTDAEMLRVSKEIGEKSSELNAKLLYNVNASGHFDVVEFAELRARSIRGTINTRSVSIMGGIGVEFIILIVAGVFGAIVLTVIGCASFKCFGGDGILSGATTGSKSSAVYLTVPPMYNIDSQLYQTPQPTYTRPFM
jgi:hypothetical protein